MNSFFKIQNNVVFLGFQVFQVNISVGVFAMYKRLQLVKVGKLTTLALCQGCVRGQHGRESRPRPDHIGSRPRTPIQSYMTSEAP